MSLLTLRRLSSLALATTLGVGCASSEDSPAAGQSGGGTKNGTAGKGDDTPTAGRNAGNGGSANGGNSSSGGKAGSETAEGGKTGTATAGTGSGGAGTAGSMAGSAADGGEPMGEGGMDAGGAPADPGCTMAAQCNDQNPCTTDACVDTVCTHTNNTDPCTDDADDCTDDVCKDGACTHLANTAACEDDNKPCTTDVCAGGICTHPDNGTCQCQKGTDCDDSNPCTTDSCVGNKCKYVSNTLNCVDDNNGCTDDVCQDGKCTHGNNTESCLDDGDACTGDVCKDGTCTHPAVSGCCSGDGDCFDNNPCTTETCVNNVCNYANNTVSCADDNSPCTTDVCGGGACKHPSNAVCSGSDDIIIFTNRNSHYVVLNAGFLDWSGTSPGTAEVFSKVGEVGSKFKLRAKSTGQYVTLGAQDALVATADLAGAMVFDAPTCGAAPWVGLSATTDQNGGTFAATDDGNHITARSGDCGAASATSWEKFKLLPATAPCTAPADCNDNNPCTDETCGGDGFCAYTDHVGTCTDDASSCTDDVCNSGTCTHPGNGTCMGPLVTIQANRNAKFVALNASYLEYTAADATSAEKFELVDQAGTQFRLRASNGMFVALDVNDNMIANASFAGSMLWDAPVCDVKVGLVATADDDANKYVAADNANRLIARSGGCGLGNAGAWEKFTIVPQ